MLWIVTVILFIFLVLLVHRVYFYLSISSRNVFVNANGQKAFSLPISYPSGNLDLLMDGFPNKIRNLGEQIFSFWVGNIPALVVSDPGEIRRILSNEADFEKGLDKELMHPFTGNSLAGLELGDEWQKCHDVFKNGLDERSMNLMVQTIRNEAKLETGHVNVYQISSKILTKCFSKCILETTPWIDDEEDELLYQSFYIMSRQLDYRFTSLWISPYSLYHNFMGFWLQFHHHSEGDITSFDTSLSYITNYSDKALDRILDNQIVSQRSFVSASANNFEKEEAIDNLNVALYYHNEKISSCVSATLYCLARDPKFVKKVRLEIDQLSEWNSKTIGDCKWLQCCILEAIRLYPPFPCYGRKNKKNETVCGYFVPKGTWILLAPVLTHRDPQFFLESEKFAPERFFSDIPQSFFGFGYGKRRCIGEKFALIEISTLIASILSNFDISCENKVYRQESFGSMLTKPQNNEFTIKLHNRE